MQPYSSPQQQHFPPSPRTRSSLLWGQGPYTTIAGHTTQAPSPGPIHPQVTEASLDMSYVHADDPGETFGHFQLAGGGTPDMPQLNPYNPMDALPSTAIGGPGIPPLTPQTHLLQAPQYPLPHRPAFINPAPDPFARKKRAPTKRRASQGRSKKASYANTRVAKPTREEMEKNLKLKPGAPEQAKFLVQSRIKHEDVKGKGMWDKIHADFAAKYGEKRRAALQMQVHRLTMTYLIWPESEVGIARLPPVSPIRLTFYHNVTGPVSC